MKIEFPGTKGEIEESSAIHKYHSSLIINYKNTRTLIDLGLKRNPLLLEEINNFDYLLITHAHPDHYSWTVEDMENVKVPVYMTGVTLDYGKYKPADYRVIKSGAEYTLEDLEVTAFDVLHSLRCPAVAYRIKGDRTIIYAPDILDFKEDKSVVLNDVDLLIADGSSLNINMVRRRDDKIFGHTRIKTVIGWCKKYGLKKLIVTHCGKQVVTMDEGELKEKINKYAEGKVDVKVAYDNYIIDI
ncbi:MAG: MBL fold metallo-hydrolase [Actinomycetota bacterium]|nr:MBL fold metallo-hydrolase [Actinomycetota bacterium]